MIIHLLYTEYRVEEFIKSKHHNKIYMKQAIIPENILKYLWNYSCKSRINLGLTQRFISINMLQKMIALHVEKCKK
ncbi:TPA: hypothetical protein RQA65_003966 [Clostridioides difficile]|nr:hypothetical protein [Clostridioides difficile]HDX7086395.1 hypothetical protein [Clostridioides difficile]